VNIRAAGRKDCWRGTEKSPERRSLPSCHIWGRDAKSAARKTQESGTFSPDHMVFAFLGHLVGRGGRSRGGCGAAPASGKACPEHGAALRQRLAGPAGNQICGKTSSCWNFRRDRMPRSMPGEASHHRPLVFRTATWPASRLLFPQAPLINLRFSLQNAAPISLTHGGLSINDQRLTFPWLSR
jgi:hypothetical protein